MDLRDSEIEEIFQWNAGRLSTADLEMFARIATSEADSSLRSGSPMDISDECNSEIEIDPAITERQFLHGRITNFLLQKEIADYKQQIQTLEDEIWNPHAFSEIEHVCTKCLLPLSSLADQFSSPESYMRSYHPLLFNQSCKQL